MTAPVNQSTDSRTRAVFAVFDNESGDVLTAPFATREAAERYVAVLMRSLNPALAARAEILTIRVAK